MGIDAVVDPRDMADECSNGQHVGVYKLVRVMKVKRHSELVPL